MADRNVQGSGFRRTGTASSAAAGDDGVRGGKRNDEGRDVDAGFALMSPRDQLAELLRREISGRPFSELASVTLDHRGATIVGHALLDALEDQGFSMDDYDAVGALTAAAVPLACAMIQAAASRGQDLDAFVMDFVYPSIKGPSIAGKRVVLLDSWLSEKSYVQTSSLVTLRNGNELSLDFGIVEREHARSVAVAALIGGVGDPSGAGGRSDASGADDGGAPVEDDGSPRITVVDPVTAERRDLPFVRVFDEKDLREEARRSHA